MSAIRAWKDEEYRLSLSEAERALLPENPAGALTDGELESVAGADVFCNVTFSFLCNITIKCFFNSLVISAG